MRTAFLNKILLIILFLLPMSILAQGPGTTTHFEYEHDGKTFKGSFSAIFMQYNGNNSKPSQFFSTKPKPIIDCQNQKGTTIKIRLQRLKWASNSHYNYQLLIHADWIAESSGLALKSSKPIRLNANTARDLLFEIIDNGEGEINIGFAVQHNDSIVPRSPIDYISKAYTIKNAVKVIRSKIATSKKTSPTPSNTTDSDERYWGLSQEQGINGLREYLELYPESGKYTNEAKEKLLKIDEVLWQEVKQLNSIEKMTSYLLIFPNGKHVEDVQKILENTGNTLWQNAKKSNTKKGYETYLDSFPNGIFADKAINKIESLGKATPEEIAYRKARRLKDKPARLGALRSYQEKYPQGKYISKVVKEIAKLSPMQLTLTRLEDVFTIILINSKKPTIDSISNNTSETIQLETQDDKFIINVLDNSKHIVFISDANNKKIKIELDASIPPLVVTNIRQTKDSFQFIISGGIPPYFAQLQKEGQQFVGHTLALGFNKNQNILTANLPTSLNGVYSLQFKDARKTEVVKKGNISVLNTKESSSIWWILSLVVLGLLSFSIYSFLKNKKTDAISKKIEQKKENVKDLKNKASVIMPSNKAIQLKKPQVNNTIKVSDKTPASIQRTFSKKMKIKEHRKNNFIVSKHEKLSKIPTDLSRHCELNIEDIWGDTAISKVYFHKTVIRNLTDFVVAENEKNIGDKDAIIPEIGGFLLGKHHYSKETKQYRVFVEKFVPIEPEDNDLYKIEFGTKAWSTLSDVQDEYEHLETIGWFHTHPGHGLFLSQPDLRIHKGFFKHPYQFAMEMDSLTESLETSFFTRQQNGEINNSPNRISDAEWFKWVEIAEQNEEI